jgi:hypothetical protein
VIVCACARSLAQLPAAKLTEELIKVLEKLGLAYEKRTEFSVKITFSAAIGEGTCSAQVFIVGPGIHMVDFRRGQSDFLAFFKLFKTLQENLTHVIDTETGLSSAPATPVTVD